MRVKLDENLGKSAAAVLERADPRVPGLGSIGMIEGNQTGLSRGQDARGTEGETPSTRQRRTG